MPTMGTNRGIALAKAATSKSESVKLSSGEGVDLGALQNALEKDRRLKPSEEQLLHFYEQMLSVSYTHLTLPTSDLV